MRKLLFILVSALAAAFTAAAQELPVTEPSSSTFGLSPSDEAFVKQMRHRMDSIRKHRPTVALVLSGGGAKGAATIGALQYMKKYDFPIDIVAGTSVGGLIGGLYALGYTPSELESLIRTTNWDMAMSDKVDKSYIPYSRLRYKEKYLLSIPFYYKSDDYILVSVYHPDHNNAKLPEVGKIAKAELLTGTVEGYKLTSNVTIDGKTYNYSNMTSKADGDVRNTTYSVGQKTTVVLDLRGSMTTPRRIRILRT